LNSISNITTVKKMAVNFTRGDNENLDFSGSDVGSVFNDLTTLTVMAWVIRTDASDLNFNIFSKWRFAATRDLGFILYRQATNNALAFDVAFDDTNNNDSVTSVADVTTNVWHFTAGRWTASEIACQLDQTIATSSISRTSISDTVTTTDLVIANQDDNVNAWDGDIAEVAAWDVALSNNELNALSRGMHPLRMRRGNMIFYCPLLNNDYINEMSGQGWQGSDAGFTLDNADHPPIQPFGFKEERIFTAAPAAAPAEDRRRLIIPNDAFLPIGSALWAAKIARQTLKNDKLDRREFFKKLIMK